MQECRKRYSTQTALFIRLKIWRAYIDKKKFGWSSFNRSKQAINAIHHKRLLAMLSAYDSVEEKSLKLFKKIQILFKYLLNRQKAVKIHLRRDLIRDFRFHLRPVLFSVYLNNPFFFLNSVEFCNFVDDARKPLLPMLEKWKRCINNGAHVFVLFMSLSKNFDTINH